MLGDAWYRIIRFLLRFIGIIFLGYRVWGRQNVPRTGGALIASNHQSYLDPILIALGLCRPVHFMARRSLFENPLFDTLIRSLKAFPVERDRPDIAGVREAIKKLRAGNVLLIFPEGTRSRNGAIGKIKPGVEMLAVRAEVPIVPAVISGAFEAWPRDRRLPRPQRITVRFGRLISLSEIRSCPDLAKLLKKEMESLIEHQ